jgi:hypothetical protein
MTDQKHFNKELLTEILTFLNETSEVNEATKYDSSREYLVNAIIELVKAKKKTSIQEDFEIPFLHPMITIQKWVEELKLLVKQSLHELSF